MNLKPFPLIVALLLMAGVVYSQQTDTPFLSKAVSKLDQINITHPVEKVYLHVDRMVHFPGDTIWYKAYTVTGSSHQLSGLSGVLYVELINSSDSLIIRQTLKLISGIAWSEMPLTRNLRPGSYRIRAYTNWMRNAGAEYFFEQPVLVSGPQVQNLTSVFIQKPDIQFFPEGGELIDNIRSKVAFKAVDANGYGLEVKGNIVDSDGSIVADISTQHLGMGVFALTPKPGKTYQAKFVLNNGEDFTLPLPKAKEDGYTLAINNNDTDSIFVKVAANEQAYTKDSGKNFYIIANIAGKTYYTSKGKLDNAIYTSRIARSRFPSGIAQFTLFSDNGQPLAERIAFIRTKDTLGFQVIADQTSYHPLKKVKLNIALNEPGRQPVAGTFSATVVNESKLESDDEHEGNIMTSLLLTSDLKGFIEKPNYYFINNSSERRLNLDILMLTQGYRRFTWQQILKDELPPINYPVQNGLELSGTVKANSGKVIQNVKVSLLVPKQSFFVDTTTNAKGEFVFKNLALTDTSKILIRARKQNDGSNVTIAVNKPDYALITKSKIPASKQIRDEMTPDELKIQQNTFEEIKAAYADTIKSIKLKDVNVKSRYIHKEPVLTNSANLNGPGHADQVIMGDAVEGCVTLSDCLQGKIMGVTFTVSGLPISSRSSGHMHAGPMDVIVDGIQLTGDYFNQINTSDVESIEVLRSGANLAIYGSNAPNGLLIINLKHGGNDQARNRATASPDGTLIYAFKGFHTERQFYSPKYTVTTANVNKTDPRNTVYWKPDILTDKTATINLEYFNNASKGTYRLIIEGIDDNGNLGRQVFRYRVE